MRSTDASLLIEITVLKHSAGHSGDGEYGEDSSSLDSQQTTEDYYRKESQAAGPAEKTSSQTTLAVGILDVQTFLVAGFRPFSATPTASNQGGTALKLARKKDAGGNTLLAPHEFPDSIPVSVKLTFSGARFSAGATPGEEQVAQVEGNDHSVPSFFVVATTLFDCATAMKEAELRLYIRSGSTGAVSRLSSGGRGEIGEPS